MEDPELNLNDGTTKIFLNATGKIGSLDADIESFLRYVNSGSIRGEFTNRVDERLRELKEREEIGVEYMTLDVMLQDVRDEAFDRGFDNGQFKKELDNLRRLIKNLNMTLKDAMNALEIPENERSKYISALEKDLN